ncbi:MAG: hypothetical protein KAJ24_02220, partial [Candidatus Aenigmarchaeota archaeon]|nr:hypothetical protein [Candidatus Aenigmarchaeota archaeon]
GKGGGKSRTSVRVTTRMHKSGRRRTLHALVIAGNCNGLLGMGYATGEDAQRAIQKAERQAKLHMVPIIRGCGSWECGCGGKHSLPFKVKGRSGSISVELLPAPIGLGLCVAHEMKKLMQFAGITDVWARSFGNTGSRLNFARATFEALKSVNKMRMPAGTQDSEESAKKSDVAKPEEQEAKKEEKAPVKEEKPVEEKKKKAPVKEEKPVETAKKTDEKPAKAMPEKKTENKADSKPSEDSTVVDEKKKPDTGKDGEEVESNPKE